MKSYHFSVGNSTDGPIGMCARVLADSEEEAVTIFHEALLEYENVRPAAHEDRIEYIHVYFNDEAITVEDIDEVDEDGPSAE